jgi:hypothetical protein
MHSRILCADIFSNTEICFPNLPIHSKMHVSDYHQAGCFTILRFCLSQLLLAKAKINASITPTRFLSYPFQFEIFVTKHKEIQRLRYVTIKLEILQKTVQLTRKKKKPPTQNWSPRRKSDRVSRTSLQRAG